MLGFYIVPLIVAILLSINMGASGTAPSFAAAYGADIIRKQIIPGLFGIFVFAGAVIAGSKVIKTVGGDVLPADTVNTVLAVIVLGSVTLSMFFANMLKVPQSTSQSTVFALAGPALYLNVLQTERLFFEIIPTWFITPILAFLISFVFAKLLFKPLSEKFVKTFNYLRQSRHLHIFVIGTSCYVAFSIGSNNVANAAAPVVSMAVNMLEVEALSPNYSLLVLIVVFMVSPFFGIGSSLMGSRVLDTTGKNIVSFGLLGASYISVITATILLVASLWRGIPTSLVQMNTAAIIALGIVKNGWKSTMKNSSLGRIFTIWIVSPIIALVCSLVLIWIADISGLL